MHTAGVQDRIKEAENTLFMAEKYMDALGREFERLSKVEMPDSTVAGCIQSLLPMDASMSTQQKNNITKLREDMEMRYFEAPDLQDVPRNAYRFINAVSDFATHGKPLRESGNRRENLFAKVVDGNAIVDKAYGMVKNIA